MFCEKCGKENKDGAAFCESCGTPMAIQSTAPAKSASADMPQQQSSSVQGAQQAQPATQVKSTSNIVLTVIGVILGILVVIIGLSQLF